jgi:hypothetical protein
MSAQIKALSMIVAIEGLIPNHHDDRRTGSSAKKSASSPAVPPIDPAARLRDQQGGTPGPQPGPAPVPDGNGPDGESISARPLSP